MKTLHVSHALERKDWKTTTPFCTALSHKAIRVLTRIQLGHESAEPWRHSIAVLVLKVMLVDI